MRVARRRHHEWGGFRPLGLTLEFYCQLDSVPIRNPRLANTELLGHPPRRVDTTTLFVYVLPKRAHHHPVWKATTLIQKVKNRSAQWAEWTECRRPRRAERNLPWKRPLHSGSHGPHTVANGHSGLAIGSQRRAIETWPYEAQPMEITVTFEGSTQMGELVHSNRLYVKWLPLFYLTVLWGINLVSE